MVKNIIKGFFFSMGYEIRRKKVSFLTEGTGRNAFMDMQKLTKPSLGLVVIDVGANEGQTKSDFRDHFEHPVIHAFEPGTAFSKLKKLTAGIPDLYLNNYALGSKSGEMDFMVHRGSDMSSLLEPSVDCWTTVKETRKVAVKTLDEYCVTQSISYVDILKSDTQGYDFEVLKGATGLLIDRRIHLVYMEIIFSDMYKGQPRFDQIYGFMADHGFHLVCFYKFFFQHDRAGWADVLFVNPEFASAK
jgi:FkbM family methyltransferase